MIDVNRDFPFDFTYKPSCLRSETSRALQLLFINNLIVMTITFHGGQQSISYEWGDMYNCRNHFLAPDYHAMHAVAHILNRYSGRSRGISQVQEASTM